MGVFESLASKISPDKLLELLEKWLPPSGRLAISLLPKLMSSQYDTKKHEIPTATIKQDANTNRVLVVYTFKTPEAMNDFYNAEVQNLEVMQKLVPLINEMKASKNEQPTQPATT